MVLEVHPAFIEDVPRCAAIDKLAFGASPFNPIFFPGPFPPEDKDKAREERFAASFSDPTTKWFKVVDTELEAEGEEAIIAYAKTNVYTSPPPPPKKRVWTPGTNEEVCEMVFGAGGMDKCRAELMGDKAHVCELFQYLHVELQNLT